VVLLAGLALVAPPAAGRTPQAADLATLKNPALFTDKAPASYRALFDTTAGIFVVEVTRAWAPLAADRFYNLVRRGFYNENRFFRVVEGFVVQWGIHGDPAVSEAWMEAKLPPERARQSNIRGRVTFAQASPDTRTTQVFINLGNNSKLDLDGVAPFGQVVSSLVLVERIFKEFGEGPPQELLLLGGNRFMQEFMPQLDYIRKATIEQ
jgi:peptidyl-prolyl cis-trans isomerase A (cyclophilin A)